MNNLIQIRYIVELIRMSSLHYIWKLREAGQFEKFFVLLALSELSNFTNLCEPGRFRKLRETEYFEIFLPRSRIFRNIPSAKPNSSKHSFREAE